MTPSPQRVSFVGASGATLAARLDLPPVPAKAYALFAHCFTCSKDLLAARAIAAALTQAGYGVLRFDFTGLGHSEGEFASTNFSMNVGDLVRAADFLRENFEAPKLLVGHSLGGAAVIAATPNIPEVLAVATVGAPSDPRHVVKQFEGALDHIETHGEAEVQLGGRPFTLQKQFVDDLNEHKVTEIAKAMRPALLVLHSPVDATVSIDQASALFTAARHPKSFVSLDTADHLLTRKTHATYAAGVIAAWAERYVDAAAARSGHVPAIDGVVVRETGQGKFQSIVHTGRHRFIADEPAAVGGDDTGPAPYDILCAALGACTTMTLRMYADRKKIPATRIATQVHHTKTPDSDGPADVFTRTITIEGDIEPNVRERMLEIADRCPVHKTLEAGSAIITKRSTQ